MRPTKTSRLERGEPRPSLDASGIASFRASFRGELVLPPERGVRARRVWNGAIDRHPALIARCSGVVDVVRAVEFAHEHELLVAVRGGLTTSPVTARATEASSSTSRRSAASASIWPDARSASRPGPRGGTWTTRRRRSGSRRPAASSRLPGSPASPLEERRLAHAEARARLRQPSVGRRYPGRALPVRSASSMARASATRVVTPILRKMLRRWVSTVFWLKKSSAAISVLVLRSTTSRAISRSRSVSAVIPRASRVPGRVRRWMCRPSFRSSRSAWLRYRSAPKESNAAATRSSSRAARSRSPDRVSARPASSRARAASKSAETDSNVVGLAELRNTDGTRSRSGSPLAPPLDRPSVSALLEDADRRHELGRRLRTYDPHLRVRERPLGHNLDSLGRVAPALERFHE